MSTLVETLQQAQAHAMAVRPKVGGFPVLAEVLRQAGVRANHWTLPACQSVYVMASGCVVQPGTPLVTTTQEIPRFDSTALVAALRADQAGHSTFPEFLQAAWNAGVTRYDVDFERREVKYYGAKGECYAEAYAQASV
ncbi:MAG: DUF1398 family protein [Proteobacteria bacterium]|nr:DUF1398 family protein [Pseudomonadota bacterium]